MEVGSEFLKALATIVIAAFVFSFAGGRLRIPTIVMYLVAGLAVGPATGLVAPRNRSRRCRTWALR